MRRQAQRGAAAVEFALLVIPLLVMLTGITEMGRALYYYNAIAKAARDGARLLSPPVRSSMAMPPAPESLWRPA
jgi:Flp pilus assembly protein TadG